MSNRQQRRARRFDNGDGSGVQVAGLGDRTFGRKPLHTERSEWSAYSIVDDQGVIASRNVHDGQLRVIVTNDPLGLHLSISHTGHGGRLRRYPSWDEIADARDVFLPAELGFVMHLPPADEYVALHDTTFHLHQHPEIGP